MWLLQYCLWYPGIKAFSSWSNSSEWKMRVWIWNLENVDTKPVLSCFICCKLEGLSFILPPAFLPLLRDWGVSARGRALSNLFPIRQGFPEQSEGSFWATQEPPFSCPKRQCFNFLFSTEIPSGQKKWPSWVEWGWQRASVSEVVCFWTGWGRLGARQRKSHVFWNARQRSSEETQPARASEGSSTTCCCAATGGGPWLSQNRVRWQAAWWGGGAAF